MCSGMGVSISFGIVTDEVYIILIVHESMQLYENKPKLVNKKRVKSKSGDSQCETRNSNLKIGTYIRA